MFFLFFFCNNFYFIINVYTFVFVICLIYNYWSLFYGFVFDHLAVLLVLSVQALIIIKKACQPKYLCASAQPIARVWGVSTVAD